MGVCAFGGALQPFGGGSSLSCKTLFVSVMPGRSPNGKDLFRGARTMPETWQFCHAASFRRQLRIFFRLISNLKVCCRSSTGVPAEPCGYGTTRREPRHGAGVHLGAPDGIAIACSGSPPCSSDRSLPAPVALRAARCHADMAPGVLRSAFDPEALLASAQACSRSFARRRCSSCI
jgi:hypothetical protein